MRPRFAFVTLLAPCLLASSLATPSAHATTLRYQSAESLATGADAVVWARVTRVGTRMRRRADGLSPEREAQLDVHEVLAGAAPATLAVALRGGAHPGGEHRVDGEARLTEGRDVVAFLVQDGGRWRVLGMSLGVWEAQASAPLDAPTGGAAPAAEGVLLVRHVDDAVVFDAQGSARTINETVSLSALRALVQRARRDP